LQPADAARTKNCQRCHCILIAPLGFAATAARRGRDFAIRAAASKRKTRPSSLEAQVEMALRSLHGIAWEREVAVERPEHLPYFVDFVVITATSRIALEVNGTYAHRHDTDEHARQRALEPYFDTVIILTETTIRQVPDLTAHLSTLLL
jgi:very-short-patch-repair endonuclease